MSIDQIQHSFKEGVASSIELLPQGIDRYQIYTPFHFDDGDHFVISLQKNKKGYWILSDEGHTYMHMSYNMDISTLADGTSNMLIENALEKYGIKEKEGQIYTRVNDPKNAGNILHNFIQCLLHITDVSYLSRERTISTFMEDFRKFISKTIKTERIKFNYHDETHDPKGKYPIDCYVNSSSSPMHIYAIGNDDKCRDTTINILQSQRWNKTFSTLAIFEDQEQISRKVLSRFTDICDRQFPSLTASQDKIEQYLQNQIN